VSVVVFKFQKMAWWSARIVASSFSIGTARNIVIKDAIENIWLRALTATSDLWTN
jgi:hypothetical protein